MVLQSGIHQLNQWCQNRLVVHYKTIMSVDYNDVLWNSELSYDGRRVRKGWINVTHGNRSLLCNTTHAVHFRQTKSITRIQIQRNWERTDNQTGIARTQHIHEHESGRKPYSVLISRWVCYKHERRIERRRSVQYYTVKSILRIRKLPNRQPIVSLDFFFRKPAPREWQWALDEGIYRNA